MLFCVWLYFIFLSVFDYSVSKDSNIDLYCLPDLYFRHTYFKRLCGRFFNTSVYFNLGFVFQAYSSFIMSWTEYSVFGSSLLAFRHTQSTISFCWINGSHLSGDHSYPVSLFSLTQGARHINIALLSFPSLTSTNPSTKTLVFPQTKHSIAKSPKSLSGWVAISLCFDLTKWKTICDANPFYPFSLQNHFPHALLPHFTTQLLLRSAQYEHAWGGRSS